MAASVLFLFIILRAYTLRTPLSSRMRLVPGRSIGLSSYYWLAGSRWHVLATWLSLARIGNLALARHLAPVPPPSLSLLDQEGGGSQITRSLVTVQAPGRPGSR